MAETFGHEIDLLVSRISETELSAKVRDFRARLSTPEFVDLMDQVIATLAVGADPGLLAKAWEDGVLAKSNSSSIFDADVLAKNPYLPS